MFEVEWLLDHAGDGTFRPKEEETKKERKTVERGEREDEEKKAERVHL